MTIQDVREVATEMLAAIVLTVIIFCGLFAVLWHIGEGRAGLKQVSSGYIGMGEVVPSDIVPPRPRYAVGISL